MPDRISELFHQADARLAELKASPQGEKLAEWDESFGRLLSWVMAAAWVIGAGIAASMAMMVAGAVDGEWRMAAAGIGAAIVGLLLWRAWSAVRRVRTVSKMVLDDARERLGPARWVLGAASRLRTEK
jgi:hypothetical protein